MQIYILTNYHHYLLTRVLSVDRLIFLQFFASVLSGYRDFVVSVPSCRVLLKFVNPQVLRDSLNSICSYPWQEVTVQLFCAGLILCSSKCIQCSSISKKEVADNGMFRRTDGILNQPKQLNWSSSLMSSS